ncbi:MAG: hypothetical protein Q3X12_00185, partial [Hallella sp.]|nr:hypothetical protein [Hallella sp.]
PWFDRACFAVRSGMFRGAKGHLSQGVRWNEGCEMFVFECKALNVRQLRKCAENGVFRPNIFVVEKKCVD